MPGYAAALAALEDEQLVGLLSRRADLRTGQPPGSFAELASRAGAAGSIQAALALLDAGTLQLAELLAVLGLPTTVDQIAAAAGPGLTHEALMRRLGRLAELGLALPGPDGTVSGPRGIASAFARPGGLGPGVAELARIGVTREQLATAATHLGVPADGGKADLIRTVSAALSDPDRVGRVLATADAAATALLERARSGDGHVTVTGAGGGRYADHPDAHAATWLLERGLLLPATYERLVVPYEAEIALRSGFVFPHWPDPPRLPDPQPFPPPGDGAAAAAHRLVLAAEGLAARLDRAPIPLIKTGTVSVRDLRRLAAELDLAEDEAAFLLDLMVAAGLVTDGGPWDNRSIGLTSAADEWLAGTRAQRWTRLVTTWRDEQTAFEEHLLHRHGLTPAAEETPRPLQVRQVHGTAARRRGLLTTLAQLPAGHGADTAAAVAVVRWQAPRRWRPPAGTHAPGHHRRTDGVVRAVLSAAALLGLAAVSGNGADTPEALAGPGLGAGAWLAGDDQALTGQAAAALGDGAREFLIAGDLTVVAPGGLEPDVGMRLSAMADRASTGGAATWRIDATTLRRALDTGETGESLLAFLNAHSQTPVPPALEYLVTDTQRRHGRIRVGQAATYLRGDPAVVAELARSAAGRRLDLRELAPGVLVTHRDQEEVLAALRRAGESPQAEASDGTPLTQAAQPVRHTPHHRPPVFRPDAPDPAAGLRPPAFRKEASDAAVEPFAGTAGSYAAGGRTEGRTEGQLEGRPGWGKGRPAGPPAPADPAALVARLRAAPTPAGGNGHRHPRPLSEAHRG